MASAQEFFACVTRFGQKRTCKFFPMCPCHETYYEQYGADERFVFKKYEDRGHSILDYPDGSRDFELMKDVADFFDLSLSDAESR